MTTAVQNSLVCWIIAYLVYFSEKQLILLSSLANAISMSGGYLGVNIRGHVSWHLYWFQVFDALSFGDVISSLIKTFFFGFAIGIVGC
ncbi:ABC transporter permease [Pleomorphovibrio marinus]|uniref:ABC transporter permease n=1 Tax=Pleomorphovibrio marinus TaxID=2164132 RepID=UPI001E61A4A5|nr:ABC transporter permease [Pleomorphovibrio marinus]